MAVSWYLYILILFIMIPLQYCLNQCLQQDRIKRDTVFDITDDLLVNQNDRFIRSNSQNSQQVGDVVMIMDISQSLSQEDRENQRQTLRMLGSSKKINIGKKNVRIGIIAFETQAHMILHLDEGVTDQAVIAAAEKVNLGKLTWTKGQEHYGSTNFPDAMNLAKKEFQEKGRNGKPRVALLVTDGNENCAPWQTTAQNPCSKDKDCNQIAQMCPRPASPGDECCFYKQDINWQQVLDFCARSPVFGEFRELRNQQVILPIVGVGHKLQPYGKERLRCWATEGLYFELPSYNRLEKTVERLVRTILPIDPAKDCECKLYTNETCRLVNNTCGRYNYVIITRNATGNGRPCPTKRKVWLLCSLMMCGVTFGNYTPVPEVVLATTPSGDRSGVAWWIIFVILLAILAILLCLAILIIAIFRKKRVRRAVTSGVQPSLMQPLSVRPVWETSSQQRETPAPPGGIAGVGTPTQQRVTPASPGGITGIGVGRSVEKSQTGVSKSAQPSTRFLGSQQQKAGTMGAFHKVSVSRPISSQTTQERDKSAQPGMSLMPSSATKWGSFAKLASKKK